MRAKQPTLEITATIEGAVATKSVGLIPMSYETLKEELEVIALRYGLKLNLETMD